MADIYYDVDAALAEVPVNLMPLLDDTTFKTIEDAVVYNAAGLALNWHFVTTAGAYSVTAVTPTDTGGNYDWVDQGTAGVYTIEIPASGGASINNDTEGFGWFTGVATGVLPWRSAVYGFRAAGINNALIDGATVDVNVTAISGDTTAADNLELMYDGTGYAGGTTKLAVADVTLAASQGSYAPAKAGDAMTLTAAYDAAKTAAAAGAKMDIVDAPNATAVTAIQNGLAATGEAATAAGAVTLANGAHGGAAATLALGGAGGFTGDITGDLSGSVGSVSGHTAQTADVADLITTVGAAGAGLTALGDVRLANLDAAITSRSTYAGEDTAGTTTLLTRLSALWAAQLDAAISTRLATTGYTAPDNAGITTIAGYLDTEIASILAAVDTEIATLVSELAKVPKSDSTVSWNATAKAAIAVAFLDSLLSAGDADALNARTVRSALRAIRNKQSVNEAGDTLTVTKENDTDAAWTAAITTDAASEPITAIDPA